MNTEREQDKRDRHDPQSSRSESAAANRNARSRVDVSPLAAPRANGGDDEAMVRDRRDREEAERIVSQLETRLLSPVVSGELDTWAARLSESAQAADENFRQRLKRHVEMLDATAASDSELLPRVEQLRETCEQLKLEYRALREESQMLADQTRSADDQETDHARLHEMLVRTGSRLVQQTRQMQIEIDTWYQESLWRDRGVAD